MESYLWPQGLSTGEAFNASVPCREAWEKETTLRGRARPAGRGSTFCEDSSSPQGGRDPGSPWDPGQAPGPPRVLARPQFPPSGKEEDNALLIYFKGLVVRLF